MNIKNKLYNCFWKVRRVRTKGSVNCGKRRDGCLVKYDWNKEMRWMSPTQQFGVIRESSRMKLLENKQ